MNSMWPVLSVCVCLSVRYRRLDQVSQSCTEDSLSQWIESTVWHLALHILLSSIAFALLAWCTTKSQHSLTEQRFGFSPHSKKPDLILPGNAEFEYPFSLLTCNLPLQVSRRVTVKLKQKGWFLMTHPWFSWSWKSKRFLCLNLPVEIWHCLVVSNGTLY